MNGFDKVIGYDAIKLEIARICDVIKNSDKYQKLGVKIPKGLLLYGEPGVGKTLIANSFIEECGKNVMFAEKICQMMNLLNTSKKLLKTQKTMLRH